VRTATHTRDMHGAAPHALGPERPPAPPGVPAPTDCRLAVSSGTEACSTSVVHAGLDIASRVVESNVFSEERGVKSIHGAPAAESS
jgi:hypothetical protein